MYNNHKKSANDSKTAVYIVSIFDILTLFFSVRNYYIIKAQKKTSNILLFEQTRQFRFQSKKGVQEKMANKVRIGLLGAGKIGRASCRERV